MSVRSSLLDTTRPFTFQARLRTSGSRISYMMTTTQRFKVRRPPSKPYVPTATCLPTNGVPKCNQVAGVCGFHPQHYKMCNFLCCGSIINRHQFLKVVSEVSSHCSGCPTSEGHLRM